MRRSRDMGTLSSVDPVETKTQRGAVRPPGRSSGAHRAPFRLNRIPARPIGAQCAPYAGLWAGRDITHRRRGSALGLERLGVVRLDECPRRRAAILGASTEGEVRKSLNAGI